MAQSRVWIVDVAEALGLSTATIMLIDTVGTWCLGKL